MNDLFGAELSWWAWTLLILGAIALFGVTLLLTLIQLRVLERRVTYER